MLKASNNLIKDLKKQKRENSSLLFLDNIKIINDAIANGLKPKLLLVQNEALNKWGDICPTYLVESKVIEQLSDCKTPQGVLCIAEYLQDVDLKKPNTNFLVVDGLQDPGNVGTLIRTAVACRFNHIYLLDSVKPTNSKLVRSSVGTIFYAKITTCSREEFALQAKQWQLPILKSDMHGKNLFSCHFDNIVGVVVGNEGQGVSQTISQICTKAISLPMEKSVESLNAAVSGGVIMYHIYNQSSKTL